MPLYVRGLTQTIVNITEVDDKCALLAEIVSGQSKISGLVDTYKHHLAKIDTIVNLVTALREQDSATSMACKVDSVRAAFAYGLLSKTKTWKRVYDFVARRFSPGRFRVSYVLVFTWEFSSGRNPTVPSYGPASLNSKFRSGSFVRRALAGTPVTRLRQWLLWLRWR